MDLRNPEIVCEPHLVIAEFAHFPCLKHLKIQLRIAGDSGLVFQTKDNEIFVQENTAAKQMAGLLAYLQKHNKELETLKVKFVILDHKYTVTVRQQKDYVKESHISRPSIFGWNPMVGTLTLLDSSVEPGYIYEDWGLFLAAVKR